MESLLDVEDVARILNCKVGAVRELCRQRTQRTAAHPIPAIRLHKKAIRFRRSDVEAWLNQIAESQTGAAR